MGFYDYRCMVTGVSLLGAKTALFILRRGPEGFEPVALPIFGSYDRGGGVDGIEDDFTSRRLPVVFNELVSAGGIVVDWERIGESPEPFRDAETLVRLLDRNCIEGDNEGITCEGAAISYSLVSAPIVRALFASPTAHHVAEPMTVVVSALEPAPTLYPATSPDEVMKATAALSRMRSWLRTRKLVWSPPSDPSQHDDEETGQYYADALKRFADDLVVLAGLRAYASLVGRGT